MSFDKNLKLNDKMDPRLAQSNPSSRETEGWSNETPAVEKGGVSAALDDSIAEGAQDPAESTKMVVSSRGSSGNFLGRYFKEMAGLDILKPEQEFAAAGKIEALEIDFWSFLLSYPQLVEAIAAVVALGIEEPVRIPGMGALRKTAKELRRTRSAALRRRFHRQRLAVATRVYGADIDRRMLLAVMEEIGKISRGELDRTYGGRVSINPKSASFQTYMREIATRFAQTQQVRNEFVKANLRLVVSIARRFNHGRMPLGDLIQEGNVGLIKAVERYDYRRGYRFSTYASWWIRHAISRALADRGRAVRLPVHMIDAHHKVSRTRRELSAKLGHPPTAEEVADVSGIALDKVRVLDGYLMENAVSLDKEVASEDGRRFVDFIQDPNAVLPSDAVMLKSMNEQVVDYIRELKPIEADILRRRFGLVGIREQTLKEIGEDYDLSRERIRQLQEQALGKIRRAFHREERECTALSA